MSRNSDSVPPRGRNSLPHAVTVPLLASLVVKLLLIGLNRGEYTDGILQLTLFQHDVSFFPPLYTWTVLALNALGVPLLIAGRLISILASTLTALVLFALAGRLTRDPRLPVWAVWLYLAAPVQNRWALRVMTDPLFSLIFLAALVCLVDSVRHSGVRARRALLGTLFWAGLASLTRYHGLIFLPLAAALPWWRSFLLQHDTAADSETRGGWGWSPLAALPWIALAGWIAIRGFGHGQQFMARASHGLLNTFIAYSVTVEGWLLYLPWVLTYPVALLVLPGFFSSWRGSDVWPVVARLSLLLFGVWLIVQTAFQSFQFRYWLPLLPLFCLLAAQGASVLGDRLGTLKGGAAFSPKRLVAGAAIWGVLMTAAVWGLQRNTFANLTATAAYAAQLPLDTRIWCDEEYRPGVENPKTMFWSGRSDILPLRRARKFGGDLALRDGDVLLLHPHAYSPGTYVDHQELRKAFGPEFEVERLERWYFVTWPLLPDIMVSPPGSTSQPSALAYRHAAQVHWGLALRLHASTPQKPNE